MSSHRGGGRDRGALEAPLAPFSFRCCLRTIPALSSCVHAFAKCLFYVCVCVCVCRERGPPMTAEKIPRVSRKSTDFPPTDRLTAAARTKISTEEPVHVLNTSPAKRLLRSKRIGKSMKLHGRKILRPSNPMIYIYISYIYSIEGNRGEGEGGRGRVSPMSCGAQEFRGDRVSLAAISFRFFENHDRFT